MSRIELTKQRNALWLASQALLKQSAATQRLADAGLVTIERQWHGLQHCDVYVLTCAGRCRLNELDRRG